MSDIVAWASVIGTIVSAAGIAYTIYQYRMRGESKSYFGYFSDVQDKRGFDSYANAKADAEKGQPDND